MDKAHALALSTALEQRKVNHSLWCMVDPGTGVAAWNVQLDPALTYDGPTLAALANYCAQNGLTLSMKLDAMGVT